MSAAHYAALGGIVLAVLIPLALCLRSAWRHDTLDDHDEGLRLFDDVGDDHDRGDTR